MVELRTILGLVLDIVDTEYMVPNVCSFRNSPKVLKHLLKNIPK